MSVDVRVIPKAGRIPVVPTDDPGVSFLGAGVDPALRLRVIGLFSTSSGTVHFRNNLGMDDYVAMTEGSEYLQEGFAQIYSTGTTGSYDALMR